MRFSNAFSRVQKSISDHLKRDLLIGEGADMKTEQTFFDIFGRRVERSLIFVALVGSRVLLD